MPEHSPGKKTDNTQKKKPAPTNETDQQVAPTPLNEVSRILGHAGPNDLTPRQVMQLQRTIGNQNTIRFMQRRRQNKPTPSIIQREGEDDAPTKTPARIKSDTFLVYPKGGLTDPESILEGMRIANAPLVPGDMITVYEDDVFASRQKRERRSSRDEERGDEDLTDWYRAVVYRNGEDHEGYIRSGTFTLQPTGGTELSRQRGLDKREQQKLEEQPKIPPPSPTAEFSLSTLTFKGLRLFLSKLLNLSSVGVGAIATDLKFKLGLSAGAQKLLSLSVMPFLSLGAALNVQDDRRLRITGSLGFGAGIEAQFLVFLKAYANIGKKFSITGVYQDVDHFAARVISKLEGVSAAIKKGLKKLLKKQTKPKEQLTPEEIQALKDFNASMGDSETYDELRLIEPLTARTNETNKEAGASIAETVGLSGSKSTAKNTFYKNTPDGRKKKEGETTKYTFSVFIKIPGAINATVDFTRTLITNHANPDNNGDYFNFKITPGTAIPFSKDFLSKMAENIPTTQGFTLDNIGESIESNMESAAESSDFMETLGQPAEGNFALEFNYVSRRDPHEKTFKEQVESGDYFLQYARFSTSVSKSAKHDAEMPILPGLSGKFGFEGSLERSSSLFEIAGTNTATYIQTIYDGLMNRGRRGQKQWNSYKKSEKETIKLLLFAATKPSKAVHEEITGLDTSAIDDGGTVVSMANRVKRYAETGVWNGKEVESVEDVPESLMNAFDSYLEATRLATAKAEEKTWYAAGGADIVAHIYVEERGGAKVVTLEGKQPKQKDTPPSTLQEAYDEGRSIQVKIRKIGKDKTKFKLVYGGGRELFDAFQDYMGTKEFRKKPYYVALLDNDLYGQYWAIRRQILERNLALSGIGGVPDTIPDEIDFSAFESELEMRLPSILNQVQAMSLVDRRK